MNITPKNGWILLRPDPNERKTDGGIIVPDNAKRRTFTGTVLAAGEGERCEGCGKRQAVDVKPGDRVLYAEFNLAQGVRDARNLENEILIPFRDIIAIVEA